MTNELLKHQLTTPGRYPITYLYHILKELSLDVISGQLENEMKPFNFSFIVDKTFFGYYYAIVQEHSVWVNDIGNTLATYIVHDVNVQIDPDHYKVPIYEFKQFINVTLDKLNKKSILMDKYLTKDILKEHDVCLDKVIIPSIVTLGTSNNTLSINNTTGTTMIVKFLKRDNEVVTLTIPY